MVKNGQAIRKFSKEAMHIENVHDKKYWKVLERVNKVYDTYMGQESVFL